MQKMILWLTESWLRSFCVLVHESCPSFPRIGKISYRSRPLDDPPIWILKRVRWFCYSPFWTKKVAWLLFSKITQCLKITQKSLILQYCERKLATFIFEFLRQKSTIENIKEILFYILRAKMRLFWVIFKHCEKKFFQEYIWISRAFHFTQLSKHCRSIHVKKRLCESVIEKWKFLRKY